MPALRFHADRGNISTDLFKNDYVTIYGDYHAISLSEFCSNTKLKSK